MVKIKVEQDEKKEVSIFISNTVIRWIGWIATTSVVWKVVNYFISYKTTETIEIDRESMRTLLKELKRYKGLTIIDIKTNDGTKVYIKL